MVSSGTQRVPARDSGYQRETAGHKNFSKEIFGGGGVRRLRPPAAVGAGPHRSKLLRTPAHELSKSTESRWGNCEQFLYLIKTRARSTRPEVVGARRGRRRQDTDPRLFVSWLCPARCRRTSKGVPTCTYAAEPSLEVAGIEPASSGAAVGLLRAQPASGCRGWHFCRRAVPPRNQQKFPQ